MGQAQEERPRPNLLPSSLSLLLFSSRGELACLFVRNHQIFLSKTKVFLVVPLRSLSEAIHRVVLLVKRESL
jgi:hypothetical protein